jgi:hypothetical protein
VSRSVPTTAQSVHNSCAILLTAIDFIEDNDELRNAVTEGRKICAAPNTFLIRQGNGTRVTKTVEMGQRQKFRRVLDSNVVLESLVEQGHVRFVVECACLCKGGVAFVTPVRPRLDKPSRWRFLFTRRGPSGSAGITNQQTNLGGTMRNLHNF